MGDAKDLFRPGNLKFILHCVLLVTSVLCVLLFKSLISIIVASSSFCFFIKNSLSGANNVRVTYRQFRLFAPSAINIFSTCPIFHSAISQHFSSLSSFSLKKDSPRAFRVSINRSKKAYGASRDSETNRKRRETGSLILPTR